MLADGQTCGSKRGHEVVELGDEAQRRRLDDEVWGPDSRARQLRRAAKAGASGGAFGSILQGCGGCDALSGIEGCGELAGAGEGIIAVLFAVVAFILFAVVAAALVWLVSKLVAYIREKLDRPKPHGALRTPPRAGGRSYGAGTIEQSPRALIATPWKKGECAAYALELLVRAPFGGGALLRDASCAGFDITLDDGRRVRIPKGRIRVVSTRLEEDDVDRKRVDDYLRELDPHGDPTSEHSLFPYDHARALALSPGARVDVLGELEPTADATDAHGYRASAGLLVPVGIPVLRVRRAVEDAVRVRVSNDGAGGAVTERASAAHEIAEVAEEDESDTSSSDRPRARRTEPGP